MIRRFSTVVKKTPLYDLQYNLKPNIGVFSGYKMPMNFNYTNTKNVVNSIRNNGVGVFDISHMGIIKLSDRNCDNMKILLEKLFPVNMDVLKTNNSVLTLLLNNHGQIQDDLIISNLEGREYRLLVNSHNKYNILRLLNNHSITTNVNLENKIILAIQGSNSSKLLEELLDIDLNNLYFNQNLNIIPKNDSSKLEISRTGYTGEDGFELYCETDYGRYLYKKLINIKDTKKIVFGGLIDRDILRLEAGFCLSGNEFGDKNNIYYKDINMDFLIGKRRKQIGEFIGYDNINIQNYNRVGFFCQRPLREGDLIYQEDAIIGYISSSTKSYYLDKFISMGYLNNNINSDNLYTIKNNKKISLELTQLPFVPHKLYRKST